MDARINSTSSFIPKGVGHRIPVRTQLPQNPLWIERTPESEEREYQQLALIAKQALSSLIKALGFDGTKYNLSPSFNWKPRE